MTKEKEIEKDMNEMIEKSIYRNYISAGTFIRFRDKCIEFGKSQSQKDILEWLIITFKDIREVRTKVAGLSALQWEVNRKIEELTQKIKEMK